MFTTKKFSYELKDKYDSFGIDAVKKFLETKKYEVTVYPFGNFGIDLMASSGSVTLYLDAEVKTCWTEKEFPYPEINVLERKEKFMKMENSWMVFVSKNGKDLCFISGSTVLSKKKVENKNKYVEKGEFVFKVPQKEAKFIHIKENLK